jgi:hypothetical protein
MDHDYNGGNQGGNGDKRRSKQDGPDRFSPARLPAFSLSRAWFSFLRRRRNFTGLFCHNAYVSPLSADTEAAIHPEPPWKQAKNSGIPRHTVEQRDKKGPR